MHRIVYPPLVEQAYESMNKMGQEVSKDKLYKFMVEKNLIDEKGDATQSAIQEGYVSVVEVEKHDMLFKDFVNLYTLFEKYDRSQFGKIDGVWYVTIKVLEDVYKLAKENKLNEKQWHELEAFEKRRNYENPRTVGEFKGTNYPIYQDYEDESFHLVDGQWCIDESVTRDLAEKVINGEMKGDRRKAKELIDSLNNRYS